MNIEKLKNLDKDNSIRRNNAKYLNKKCFYYDPTASLIPYDGHDQFLIKGKKSLYKELSKINNKVLN